MRNFILHKRFVLTIIGFGGNFIVSVSGAYSGFLDRGLTISPFGAIALNVAPGKKRLNK